MARDGKLDVKLLGGPGAGPGKVPVHDGSRAKWADAVSAVLFVSDLADGPPTDGSVFWYVTDETC